MNRQQRRRTEVVHRRTFENRYGCTPEEYHRQHAFHPSARCAGCRSQKVAVRAITLVPLDELRKRDPAFDLLATRDPAGMMKLLVPLKHGPHVRVSTAYACQACAPALEREAARSTPSWAIVEFNRGPGPQKLVTGGMTLPAVEDPAVTAAVANLAPKAP